MGKPRGDRGEAGLGEELEALRKDLVAAEAARAEAIASVPETNRPSARNLVHYLALRRHDVRTLQDRLSELGLSSLGRAEARVLSSIDAVASIVARLSGGRRPAPRPAPPVGWREGSERLRKNTDALLGPRPAERDVRVMVTLPPEAASDYALVRDLVAGGMDAARVNCAHDDDEAWGRMIANVRRAERDVGRRCRVLMDLSGPKLRTGPLEKGPAVVSWRPQRGPLGHLSAPSRIWLSPESDPLPPPIPGAPSLTVSDAFVAALKPKDTIRFADARGEARTMKVAAAVGRGRWADGRRAAYAVAGTLLKGPGGLEGTVGEIPRAEQPIVLHEGDTLVLTRDPSPGRPALLDDTGQLVSPATVPCTLPEVFADLRAGQRVWVDDGKIGGVVRSVSPESVAVEITVAREKGEKLRSDKGINLPDSELHLPTLTPADLADLPFVAANADVVGLSFVRRPEDVDFLGRRLAELGVAGKGIVLKIETRQAFEALPELLLAALRLPRAGVMIARGDLLVECGWERLAEIQEEVLWMCEAAHLPVIWATQVLEGLAQKGLPSRAEITDAAMSERAECVMLNKGPHILDAMRVLDGILRRMQAHQTKKSPRLRRLSF